VDDRGSTSGKGRDFCLLDHIQTDYRVHPGFCPTGTGGLSSAELNTKYSSPSIAVVKNEYRFAPFIPNVFMAWYLSRRTTSLYLHCTEYFNTPAARRNGCTPLTQRFQ
jgi:hypothetical protein